jgi:L-alanine-DL-glutamate epimerase-like enolase superfamily enzyme
VPIAVGESHVFGDRSSSEYLERHACSIVQVDVGRIGGITPWLKVAHMAEAFNVRGLPALPDGDCMSALCCAIPNSRWVEYIPQLDQS